jgi:hypothetical protein
MNTFRRIFFTIIEKRWLITIIVLGTFLLLTLGIVVSIHMNIEVGQEWKELLLLMLGAFISSYGKIIDYWFSNAEKDRILTQKMDEEDGIALSNVTSMSNDNNSVKNEIDEDDDGIMDGIDEDGDGIIDIYFKHRQCEHIWEDKTVKECVKCGKIE